MRHRLLVTFDTSTHKVPHSVEIPTLLFDHAVEYARNYTGTFDPLVRAQTMIQKRGTLSVPLARTVLNCMVHDPNCWSDEPEPEPEPPKPKLYVVKDVPIMDFLHRADELALPAWCCSGLKRGHRFANFVPRPKFYVSLHGKPESKVWHVVNVDSCYMEFDDDAAIAAHIISLCKSKTNRRSMFDDHPVFTPDLISTVKLEYHYNRYQLSLLPDDRKLCSGCSKKLREQQEDEDA